jgi:ElaB/YqjD/DUF883 family membrane-anchored ribosome-binding protein
MDAPYSDIGSSADAPTDEALHPAQDVAAEIEGHVRNVTAEVLSYIERHPLTSVGIALGAGLLVAMLLRRSD